MKLSASQLKQIIKEEVAKVRREKLHEDMMGTTLSTAQIEQTMQQMQTLALAIGNFEPKLKDEIMKLFKSFANVVKSSSLYTSGQEDVGSSGVEQQAQHSRGPGVSKKPTQYGTGRKTESRKR